MLPSLRAMAAAVLLGAGLLAVPVAAPPAAIGVGPLPECRLADILTIPRDYDSWSTTLVDWILSVGPDYAPPDLVSISAAGLTGGGKIREVAFDDLKAMAKAARANGTPLGNVSAYRSYKQQKALFNSYANGYGYDKAITFSARPGHSEHQLGLTIDFADAGHTTFVSEASGAGRWLTRNAWKYGWLMSYPKGKKDLTCYSYEPWHYRYVGRDLAKKIHASGLTIREYLWSNFTTVDPTTGSPIPTGSPEPSTSPTAPGQSPGSTVPPGATASVPPSVTPGATAAPTPAVQPAGSSTGLEAPIVIVAAALGVAVIAAWATLGRRRRPGVH